MLPHAVMSHLLSVSEVGLGQLLHTHRDHFIFLAVINDNVCPSIPEMSLVSVQCQKICGQCQQLECLRSNHALFT